MAGHPVTGDQYRTIDRRMREIKRQLDQVDGSPLDPQKVLDVLQAIVEGRFDVTPSPSGRFIDCDATPYVPDGLAIESHVKGGMLEFDPSKIILHLEKGQKGGKSIKGEELRKLLEGKPTLNACVLDFLLANTALIPDSWKKDEEGRTRFIYF